jgi:hypothetical protein
MPTRRQPCRRCEGGSRPTLVGGFVSESAAGEAYEGGGGYGPAGRAHTPGTRSIHWQRRAPYAYDDPPSPITFPPLSSQRISRLVCPLPRLILALPSPLYPFRHKPRLPQRQSSRPYIRALPGSYPRAGCHLGTAFPGPALLSARGTTIYQSRRQGEIPVATSRQVATRISSGLAVRCDGFGLSWGLMWKCLARVAGSLSLSFHAAAALLLRIRILLCRSEGRPHHPMHPPVLLLQQIEKPR